MEVVVVALCMFDCVMHSYLHVNAFYVDECLGMDIDSTCGNHA